jgi:MoaA/NifB/PqqE/SkfB family radical SAM enzyme
MTTARTEQMLEREKVANKPKHWVRAVTACNSKCLFCLDADTPRNVFLPEDEVKDELRRGIEVLGAEKVIISGGEASLHPKFSEFIRYAKDDLGYDRVQTVTNGVRYADRGFYRQCMDAGLGEITFSLHGHTAELHDWLTQTPGAFKKLMKAMVRALRDPAGPIVNVDVVINKQNVGVIDKIVELAASVGVTEFDLLHVIPQANAYDNRELMFYDVRDHLERLQKVFKLNRHPRFVIWTNRFPVSFLEGMEDLIQDPHKMLDEVNGRRFMVRNYLDQGRKLDCRDVERCVHCFIEPFCTTMDRTIAAQRDGRFSVWTHGAPAADGALPGLPLPLPYGCDTVGVAVAEMADLLRVATHLPDGAKLEARVERPGAVPPGLPPLRLVADTAAALDAWVDDPVRLSAGDDLLVELTADTAAWLRQHRDRVAARLDTLWLHQPGYEHMSTARARDVRDPATFFTDLGLRLRVSGLAACAAPGAQLVDEPQRLSPALFDPDSGRLSIRGLARAHVAERYRAKSVRCGDCRVTERCDGVHINRVRDQGLKLARPLTTGAWADDASAQLEARWPTPPQRVEHGRPLEAPASSLPGFAMPDGPVIDPLAAVAQKLRDRREARRKGDKTGANPYSPRGSAQRP